MNLKIPHVAAIVAFLLGGPLSLAVATPADELADACIKGNFGKAMALINDVININGFTLKGSTALIDVVQAGEFAGVMFLVSNGADVNQAAANKKGTRPLIEAVAGGDARIVSFLIGSGADVNACDSNFITPIMAAALAGEKELVEILLKKGADVEGRSSQELNAMKTKRRREAYAKPRHSTPLQFAAEQGQMQICSLLVVNGADINLSDKRGATPLMLAALLGDAHLVRFLIQNGADIHAKDGGGRTAADYAQTLASPEILFFLTRHGAQPSDSIRFKECGGLYRCTTPTNAFGPKPYYLWFHENGTVYGLSTDVDSIRLAKIFNVHNPDMAEGSWVARGPYLHISVKAENEGVFYFTVRIVDGDVTKGTLNNGVLSADVRSSQQWATFAMKFSYVNVALYCIDSAKIQKAE